jgi:exopolysaccharide biosynthesis polyprenyl glycosylphosphotransferase
MSNFLFRVYPKYKWALAFSDLFVFHVSFLTALYFTSIYYSDPSFFFKRYREYDLWIIISVYFVCSIYYFQYSNMYKIQTISSNYLHAFLIFKSVFFIVIGFILFQFIFFFIEYESRIFYVIWFVVLSFLMLFARLPFVSIISRTTVIRDRVVIIGTGLKGRRLYNVLKNKIKFKEVIGYLDENIQDSMVEGVPVLGKIADASQIFDKYHIDYFVLAADNIKRDKFFEVFKHFQANKLPLYISSHYLRALYERLHLDLFEDFGMVRFNSQINNQLFLRIKRVFDIVISLICIILFSPLFIAIAFIIKLTSKGNIIYKQIRIGKAGRPFYFYKFRSMYLNSDKDKNRMNSMESFIKGNFVSDEGTNKIVNTSNITAIGKFIRKYSLDELPQLFNVLMGDMSLVGPRPCIVSEWRIYEKWQKYRLDFVPGCTGVWQVCGRSEVNFEESVLMDIYYNQNHSIWFDLKIMIKTISVIFLGKGGG